MSSQLGALLLASALILSFSTEVAAQQHRADALRESAITQAQSSHFDDALATLERAISMENDWSELYFLRAGVHKRIADSLSGSDPERAIVQLQLSRDDLHHYLVLEPSAPDADRVRSTMGDLEERQGDLRERIASHDLLVAGARRRRVGGWALGGLGLGIAAAGATSFVLAFLQTEHIRDGGFATGNDIAVAAKTAQIENWVGVAACVVGGALIAIAIPILLGNRTPKLGTSGVSLVPLVVHF